MFYFFYDSKYQGKSKKISFHVHALKPLEKDIGINYDIDSDEELELRDAEDCDISEMDEEMSSESNFFNKSQ